MKIVEVIGFFNEFKQGALAQFHRKSLTFGDKKTLEMIVETNNVLGEEDGHSDESGSDDEQDEFDQNNDSGAEADIEASRPRDTASRE